eukprot:scaffold328_cov130-Cylindrotheca_fusiformis.AAC.11
MEEQRAEMTDYQDYLFYSRIVSGIRKQQNKTKDEKLRVQNQALIDHINYTRYCQTPPRATTRRSIPKMPSVNHQLECLSHKGVLLAARDQIALAEEDNGMIFDIEV